MINYKSYIDQVRAKNLKLAGLGEGLIKALDEDVYKAKWEDIKRLYPNEKNIPRKIAAQQAGLTKKQASLIKEYIKSNPDRYLETGLEHLSVQDLMYRKGPSGKLFSKEILSDMNKQLKEQGVKDAYKRQELISERVFGRKMRYVGKGKFKYIE